MTDRRMRCYSSFPDTVCHGTSASPLGDFDKRCRLWGTRTEMKGRVDGGINWMWHRKTFLKPALCSNNINLLQLRRWNLLSIWVLFYINLHFNIGMLCSEGNPGYLPTHLQCLHLAASKSTLSNNRPTFPIFAPVPADRLLGEEISSSPCSLTSQWRLLMWSAVALLSSCLRCAPCSSWGAQLFSRYQWPTAPHHSELHSGFVFVSFTPRRLCSVKPEQRNAECRICYLPDVIISGVRGPNKNSLCIGFIGGDLKRDKHADQRLPC